MTSGLQGTLRRPGRAGRWFTAVAVVVVVGVAGVGLGEYVATQLGTTTLVIYTYPSLFGGVDCGAPAFASVFGAFASAHHVRIEVDCPPGTLYNTLLEQRNAPGADLVIGLDEITTPEAEASGLLVPYAPPALADEPSDLVSELSPDHGAVPYEYGYLAIDYTRAFDNATDGAVAHATFPDFVGNASTWATQLVTEQPSDITGEEFLAWEVEYYTTVLHRNWTTFWTAIEHDLPPPATSWGLAFDEFDSVPNQDQMVVSYSTDPAYARYYNLSEPYNATVAWWNGTAYGWKTIYGIGIVAGSRHLTLDQEFENWFLSGSVEARMPTTEWEYPANTTVALPSVYAAAVPPGAIVPLNDRLTPSALGRDAPGWATEWQELFA